MDNIISVFRVLLSNGKDACIAELEIDSEVVYDVYVVNELLVNLRSFRIVKRNGEWFEQKKSVKDWYFSFWGNLIDEYEGSLDSTSISKSNSKQS